MRFPISARTVAVVAGSAILMTVLLLLAALGPNERRAATTVAPWYPQTTRGGDTVQAVFQSRVPCLDEKARATPGCQRVKVALVLYQDPQTGRPATY